MSIQESNGITSISSIDDKPTLSRALYEVIMMALNSGMEATDIYEMVSLAKYKLEILMIQKESGLAISCSIGSNSVN